MAASCLFMRTNLICCCGLKNLIFFIFTFFTNLSIVNFATKIKLVAKN